MIIGVPKEIKNNESRVGLTPAGVAELVKHGHTVYVQHTAGENSGFDDAQYEAVGGAESLESLIKRTSEFLEEVAMPLVNEGKDVLILGHCAMNSAIIGNIRHKELKDFWAEGIENCKLIKLL